MCKVNSHTNFMFCQAAEELCEQKTKNEQQEQLINARDDYVDAQRD